ncbi:hypothetical protein PMAYCL1PPCAC_00402, partial [Pristionchus mayeri]
PLIRVPIHSGGHATSHPPPSGLHRRRVPGALERRTGKLADVPVQAQYARCKEKRTQPAELRSQEARVQFHADLRL